MRAVSSVLKDAIYHSNTERVFIVLVEISHSTLSTPLRFTSDGADTIHDGDTYKPFQFKLSLPDEGDGVSASTLQIQNVHRDIVKIIRSLPTPPDFKILVVLDDDTNRIEAGPWNMKLAMTEYDDMAVSAEIQGPSLLSEPYPGHSYNVIDYPSL